MRAVTHNGNFHSDDIFAAAILKMVYPDIEIVRSRDEAVINAGDIVFDVGRIYDQSKNRFDHHQEGGAGARSNTVPYASFGLVWKAFGLKLCSSQDVVQIVDTRLIAPIDAVDNGVDICTSIIQGILPYSIQQTFSAFVPVWNEEEDFDTIFFDLVEWAQKILVREIQVAESFHLAKKESKRIYDEAPDKRIIVLDARYPLSLFQEYTEVLYVIYHGAEAEQWHVKAMRLSCDSFDMRKPLPAEWAGKEREELVNITGVSDALFCHNKRFLVVAKTKEGAIKLAELALKR